MGQRGANEVDRPDEVGRDDVLDLVIGQLLGRPEQPVAGIADEHVDTPEIRGQDPPSHGSRAHRSCRAPRHRTGQRSSAGSRPSVPSPGIPAFVHNGRLDILHANQLASALYSEQFRDPMRPPSSARFLFLDPRARIFYMDWDTVAHDVVAALRGEAGRNSYDCALTDLIGMLSTRSDPFRVLWAGHDVRFHRSGTKRFHHPLVGDLTLAYESLDLPADAGLTIVTYSAEPGSESEVALRDLERWSATRAKLSPVGTAAPA